MLELNGMKKAIINIFYSISIQFEMIRKNSATIIYVEEGGRGIPKFQLQLNMF